jgi:hypothetical protein
MDRQSGLLYKCKIVMQRTGARLEEPLRLSKLNGLSFGDGNNEKRIRYSN